MTTIIMKMQLKERKSFIENWWWLNELKPLVGLLVSLCTGETC